MSKAWDEVILKAFGPVVESVAEAAVPGAARRATATPGLRALITEKIGHEVRRFAEDELGVPPELRYADEFEFFDKYLTPAYETGGASQSKGWCARWFEHRSVRLRIRAMWQRYEVLARTDPGSCDERFLRDVGDHHMDRLTGERSPMSACLVRHQPSKILPTAPVDTTPTAATEGELP